MEWAIGIGFRNRSFVGRLVRADGAVEEVPLAALADRGVPIGGRSKTRCLAIDLHSGQTVAPEIYLSAFGLHTRCTPDFGHDVLSFRRACSELLIPSLVLLRGLFRPKKHLLPLMFGPHALDQICHLDFSVQPPRVVLEGRWAFESHRQRSGELEQPVRWMNCFPSAANMAASVHRMALDGRIAVELPRARARVFVHGLRRGRQFLVTKLTTIEVVPQEEPADFARGLGSRILYRRPCFGPDGSSRNIDTNARVVPRHPDDSVEVTDSEWAAIEPLLLSGMREASIKLDQRAILDGILAKHAHDISWRQATFRAGNKSNAQYAYRNWVARGVYQRVLVVLDDIRREAACNGVTDVPGHRARDVATDDRLST